MLLLLGGTSETAPLAEALAKAGHRVLVSTATEIELFVGSHPRIEHRRGRLDGEGMAQLIRERSIRAIIDATHPYATAVQATAVQAAQENGIPYLRYERPGCTGETAGISIAANHEEAAQLACKTGKPILLTTGSRYVMSYAVEAQRKGISLVARVLDHPESLESCRNAGIAHVLTGRGPFSVEENRRVIREYGIGVLVTKDSGNAGGVHEKLEAARLENCEVIVVGRPETSGGFNTVEDLIHTLNSKIPPPPYAVLAMDLESVLVPEMWERIAAEAGVSALALTTRDIPDYDALMRQRILLCREHGLTLVRLREIVAAMEPLPGALEFLAWAQSRALIVIISDTFQELAAPLMHRLGSPILICHSLILDDDGYLSGYVLRDSAGKPGAIASFQKLGWRVAAVGDSFNDLAMLEAADAPFLFRPAGRVLEAGVAFPPIWTFDELKTAISRIIP